MQIADTLTARTTRAAQWRLASSVVGAASQLGVGVLLARLLTPADFGVAALAYVVLGLAQPLGDIGVGRAIVRQSRVTDHQIRTAFTCCLLGGLVVATVIVVAAPLAAALIRDPKVVSVLRVLSAGIAVRGMAVVAEALLLRQLDFRRQFMIETASYLVGYAGVAVTLALLGYGVWSLVWGGLAQTLVASIAQMMAVRHPSRPLLATRELRDLLGFGLGATASACVNYVALNGDYFLIGRLMGAFNLGLYTRAYGLMNLPHTYGSGVMSSVMFPAFAQMQQEPARVRSGYLVVTRLTAMIAAPAMTTMAVVAPHLVRGFYGPQWIGAVAPLQILSIAGYFRALYHLGGIVAQSVGRVYGELWRQVTYAAAIVGGTLVGSRYGLPGVAIGVSAAILYMFVVTGQLALRATATTWRTYLRVQVGAIVTASFTCAVALFVRLLLESTGHSPAAVAVAVLAAAAVPWGLGLLWTLGERELEPLRTSLPDPAARLVDAVRRLAAGVSHRAINDRIAASPRSHVLIERRIGAREALLPGEIRAFSKCRNERLRLPSFLHHYRGLGVNQFFIVDNDSSDGTTEYLAAQSDVQLFRAAGRFSEARGGIDWLNALLREFGVGSWCVTVDIDELLVYPGSEDVPLRALTEHLDRGGHEALSCLLLDCYPPGPLSACNYQAGGNLIAAAPYFDSEGYARVPTDLCPGVFIRGGMRERIFFPESSARPPCLTKVPLVRWDEQSEYLSSTHFVSRKAVATDTGVLLHFKFLSDFHHRAVQEAERAEYFDGASEYRRYAEKLNQNPDLILTNNTSTRFEGTRQLVRLGLMQDTPAWTAARTICDRTDPQIFE
jgi:PST family polysaccharide transporter